MKLQFFKNINRSVALVLGCFAIFLNFDILWALETTFRGMSNPSLYVNALFFSFVLTIPFLIFRKLWLQSIILLSLACLLEANLMYCRTYFTAIPLDSYMLAGNLKDFTASVWDSLRWSDLSLLIVTVAVIWCSARISNPRPGKRFIISYTCWTLGLACISWLLSLSDGGFRKSIARMEESCYYSTCVAPVYTVFGNMLYQGVGEATAGLTPESMEIMENWLSDKERLRPLNALPDSIGTRRNLVLILCESLESWVLETEIDGKPITPYLDSLIGDSSTLYAPSVMTQVGAGRSIDCQLLINAGMMPMLSNVYSMKYPASTYYTLTKAMKERGNARGYILTCDKPIVWNQEVIAGSFGIDTVLHRSSWRNDELVGNPAKLSDGSFMRQSVEKLKQGDIWPVGETAFIQWVTYSGHNPFVLPEKLWDPEFNVPESWPKKGADYIRMAHYTDESLKELIEYLKSRPDYDETLIVITGDHEGLASNRSELRRNKELAGIIDPGRHTPLIVLNSPVPGRYEKTMGQIDVYPTILQLMGLTDYEWKGMGQSVLDPSKPAIASSMGVTEGDSIGVPSEIMENILSSGTISDMIIRYDYFGRRQ